MTVDVNCQNLDTNLIDSQEMKNPKKSALAKAVISFAFLLPLFPGMSMEEKNSSEEKTSPIVVFYDPNEVKTETFYNYIDTSKINPSLFGSLPKIGEKKDNTVIAGPHVIFHKYVTENKSERSPVINPCLSALRKDILAESFTGTEFKDEICTNIQIAYLRYCNLSKDNDKENTEKLAGTIQEMYTNLVLGTYGLAYGFVMSDWKEQSSAIKGNLSNQRENEILQLKEKESSTTKDYNDIISKKNELVTKLKETGAGRSAKHIQATEQEIIEIKKKILSNKNQINSEIKNLQERIEILIRKQQSEYEKALEYFNYIFGDLNKNYLPSFLLGGKRVGFSVYCFESNVTEEIQRRVISELQESLQTKLSPEYEDFKKLFSFKEVSTFSSSSVEDSKYDDIIIPSNPGVQNVIENVMRTKPNPKSIEVKKKPQNNKNNQKN